MLLGPAIMLLSSNGRNCGCDGCLFCLPLVTLSVVAPAKKGRLPSAPHDAVCVRVRLHRNTAFIRFVHFFRFVLHLVALFARRGTGECFRLLLLLLLLIRGGEAFLIAGRGQCRHDRGGVPLAIHRSGSGGRLPHRCLLSRNDHSHFARGKVAPFPLFLLPLAILCRERAPLSFLHNCCGGCCRQPPRQSRRGAGFEQQDAGSQHPKAIPYKAEAITVPIAEGRKSGGAQRPTQRPHCPNAIPLRNGRIL